MNKTLTYEVFDTRRELVAFVNKHNIKQEDIQQITGADKELLDSHFTLWYWSL